MISNLIGLPFIMQNLSKNNKKEVAILRQPLEFTTLKNPQRFVFFRPGAKGTLTH
jgi:hypothetical protein